MVDRRVFRQIYLSSSTRFHQCHHFFDRHVPRYWINPWEKDPHAFHKHKWRAAQRRKRQRWGVNVGINRPHGSDNLADPHFLNGRELAVEAQRAVELGDRNPKFWRQVIERTRTGRDLMSVADLCTLLDCLVAVNVRHTDLLKLLTREFIDDMDKATDDNLASMLNAYAYFQCKSDTLLAAAAGQLDTLLNGEGVRAASLVTIVRSFRHLDFSLDPSLLDRCRNLCHEYAWTNPAFQSIDDVVRAYDGIINPTPVRDECTLPAWAETGSLQSAASLLVTQGHNPAIGKPLLQRLVREVHAPDAAQQLPSTVTAFAKRDLNPLTPLWSIAETHSRPSDPVEADEEFELQADWDDLETASAPAPKTTYHFQWYNHITRQVRSKHPRGQSYFNPHAVRSRHNAGRIVGMTLRALAQHERSIEQDDEFRQLARDFVNRSIEIVPVIAKNLHPEDLQIVTHMWTTYGVQDAKAWQPVSMELVRKFVQFDGAGVQSIRAAIRSWPEIPDAALLNRSVKQWGWRKIITEKHKNSCVSSEIQQTT